MAGRQKIRKFSEIAIFLLFPIIIFYFSPYIIIMGAMRGVAAGCLIMFTIQFVVSLFFGRAQCGYACPVGGLQECLLLANDKKTKGGKQNLIKYFIWAPWAAAIIALFVGAGGVKEVNFFFFVSNGVSLSEPYSYVIYYGILLLVVILALTVGKRAFCHCVCWMAPFMVIGTKASALLKLPRLQLKANKNSCTNCKLCSQKCPMSLDVPAMVESGSMKNPECILCGECIDSCPKKSIAYTFKNPRT